MLMLTLTRQSLLLSVSLSRQAVAQCWPQCLSVALLAFDCHTLILATSETKIKSILLQLSRGAYSILSRNEGRASTFK